VVSHRFLFNQRCIVSFSSRICKAANSSPLCSCRVFSFTGLSWVHESNRERTGKENSRNQTIKNCLISAI